MNKNAWVGASAILLATAFTLARPVRKRANADSWSGVIVNGTCNADEAFAEAAKCTAETPGARSGAV